MLTKVKSIGATACLFVGLASPAGATVLTFEPPAGAIFVDQSYGDRVAAVSQDFYTYNLDGGTTPNIEASYDAGALHWDEQYGDLTDVLFDNTPAGFELTLTADPGFKVVLHSFDMAGWSFADYTINSVTVVDGDGNTLFTEPDASILGAGPSHTSFDLVAPVVAPVVKIHFDSENLGGNFSNVGIDNVKFSQSAVPEPTAVALWLAATCCLLRRRRAQS